MKINEILDNYKHSLIDLGTAHSAIISVILEKMPKEKKSIFYQNETDNCLWTVGFNSALIEMRERIKEL